MSGFAETVIWNAKAASTPLYGLPAEVDCVRSFGGGWSNKGKVLLATLDHRLPNGNVSVGTGTLPERQRYWAAFFIAMTERARRRLPWNQPAMHQQVLELLAKPWESIEVPIDEAGVVFETIAGATVPHDPAGGGPYWSALATLPNGASIGVHATNILVADLRLARINDLTVYVETTKERFPDPPPGEKVLARASADVELVPRGDRREISPSFAGTRARGLKAPNPNPLRCLLAFPTLDEQAVRTTCSATITRSDGDMIDAGDRFVATLELRGAPKKLAAISAGDAFLIWRGGFAGTGRINEIGQRIQGDRAGTNPKPHD